MIDMDDFFHSLHRSVKESPGGISGVARQLGMRELTLVGKLNPNDETHFPNVSEFIRILRVIDETSSLDVLCRLFDGRFSSKTNEKSKSLIEAIIISTSEHADIGLMIQQLAADGELDAKDKSRVRAEIHEARHRLSVLENTLDAHEGGLS